MLYSIKVPSNSWVKVTMPETREEISGTNCFTMRSWDGDLEGGSGVGTLAAATVPHGLPFGPSSHVATRGPFLVEARMLPNNMTIAGRVTARSAIIICSSVASVNIDSILLTRASMLTMGCGGGGVFEPPEPILKNLVTQHTLVGQSFFITVD